jgi:hypothetical protein
MAAHALFIIAAESNRTKEATAFALQAFKRYGTTHPRVVPLAYDVATFWLNQGQFSRALPVIEAVMPHVVAPEDRAIGWATAARAAAALGNEPTYVSYRNLTYRELPHCKSRVRYNEALLALARAGASIGDNHAYSSALDVAEWASRNGLAQLVLEAEAVRDSTESEPKASCVAPVESFPTRQSATRLAQDLVACLEHGPRPPAALRS